MSSAASILRASVTMLLALTLVTGVAYPLAVTGFARAFFPERAGGSLLRQGGVVVGSRLIGQPFDDPSYFWGRPSATTPFAYDAAASRGSNLGPTNAALTAAARARIEALRLADPDNTATVPVDLVTASGSGLDPHISLAAAEVQVRRVARLRGLSESRVRAMVQAHTVERGLGIFGEPAVEVLPLNLALDAEAPNPSRP
ncbi:MAG: potassium-transporting ATPase subunit KdpC [Labilithrix sp.]|nr:potassium-transporting ATPase subunit KdpC [Labilithrix sp.]